MFQKIIASDMGRIDFVSRIKNFRPETVSHCLIHIECCLINKKK